MYKIDTPDATSEHLFTEGDPVAGVQPTEVSADWLNAVQMEICNAITLLGGTLNKADSTQLEQIIAGVKSLITAHVGSAGSAHAVATRSPAVNGFMSSIDKIIVENIARAGWSVRMAPNLEATTVSQFTDAASYRMGILGSRAGSLVLNNSPDLGSWLFEMLYLADADKTLNMPIVCVDDGIRVFVADADGANSTLVASAATIATTPFNLSVTLPAGGHRLQIILQGDNSGPSFLLIGEWMRVSGLTFQGVPDQWMAP